MVATHVTPAELIAEKFDRHRMNFAYYVNLHLLHGFLFSTPEYFIMGRGVVRSAEAKLIRDPAIVFPQPDAWWIHAMAGNTRKAWGIMPYPLGWIGFERFDELPRFYSMEDIRRFHIPEHEMEKSAATA